MARPLRIEYEGALYHVTSRGNARQSIFTEDDDRERFLKILARVVDRFHWACHAYCLMDNHYHLIIETPKGNLSRGMRQLNGLYTQAYNRCHGKVGHLLQGRYKAILVDKESYCLELSRYVVLNPVRAKKVKSPKDYRWSSYHATAGLTTAPGFLTRSWLLGQFGRSKNAAEAAYRRFVGEGMNRSSPWREFKGQAVLGPSEFIERLADRVKGFKSKREIPRRERFVARPSLRVLFPEEGFESKAGRNKAMRRAHVEFGYTLIEIARELGLHYTTVSKVVNVLESKN